MEAILKCALAFKETEVSAGAFSIPAHIEKSSVKFLIKHMLQVDPMKRASIRDIRDHEWFKLDLPEYLFPQNNFDDSIVDVEAIREVCEKFSVTDTEVRDALMAGDPHHQLRIAYYLIIDNKRMMSEADKSQMKDFYLASSPPPRDSYLEENFPPIVKVHPERVNVLALNSLDNVHPMAQDIQRRMATPIKRSKWHLGIRSQSRPHDIMSEVYRAMKTLNYEWKVINAFHVHVRRANPVTGLYSKMSLQLYQVDNKSYLLDFKSLSNTKEGSVGDDKMDIDEPVSPRSPSSPTTPMTPTQPKLRRGCQTMEFFEMCASLIGTLAR